MDILIVIYVQVVSHIGALCAQCITDFPISFSVLMAMEEMVDFSRYKIVCTMFVLFFNLICAGFESFIQRLLQDMLIEKCKF